MKKIFISIIFGLGFAMTNSLYAGERDAIYQILRDIQYTEEVVKQLQRKYQGKSKGRIKFDYNQLIVQLQAAQVGIKPYLNAKITEIHTKPRKPISGPLYQVKEN